MRIFRIYDAQTLAPKTILRNLESWEWRLDFQGTGGASFAGSGVCPAQPFDFLADAQTGDLMVVLRVVHTGGGWQLEAKGAVEMLAWRTIFPRMDPLNGSVTALLAQILNSNLRGLPLFTVDFPAFGGDSLQTSAIGGTLLDKLHAWCAERLDCGYRAVLDTSQPGKIARLELLDGRDRTGDADNVFLSTRLGTLALTESVADVSAYRTKAYVGGQGEGAERVFSETPDPPEGTPRLEVFVDARNASPEEMSAAEYQQSLLQEGLDALAERPSERRYTVTVSRDKWDLIVGDRVNLHIAELDMRGDARVASVKLSGGGAEEQKEVTLGTQAWTYKPARAQL